MWRFPPKLVQPARCALPSSSRRSALFPGRGFESHSHLRQEDGTVLLPVLLLRIPTIPRAGAQLRHCRAPLRLRDAMGFHYSLPVVPYLYYMRTHWKENTSVITGKTTNTKTNKRQNNACRRHRYSGAPVQIQTRSGWGGREQVCNSSPLCTAIPVNISSYFSKLWLRGIIKLLLLPCSPQSSAASLPSPCTAVTPGRAAQCCSPGRMGGTSNISQSQQCCPPSATAFQHQSCPYFNIYSRTIEVIAKLGHS